MTTPLMKINPEMLEREMQERQRAGCRCSPSVAKHNRAEHCDAHRGDDPTRWYRWAARLGQSLGALLAETGLPNDDIQIPEDVAPIVQMAIDLEAEIG